MELKEKMDALPKLVWESAYSVRRVEDERVWAQHVNGNFYPIAWVSDLMQVETPRGVAG